jgi:hypothetical protein
MLAALLLAPIVAVLPFRDTNGGAPDVGEAVRALIAGELREAGLELAPPDALERALDAAHADGRAEIDARTAAEVLRTLGASWLVTGAFSAHGEKASLWARFFSAAGNRRGRPAGTASATVRPTEWLSAVHAIDLDLVRVMGLHDDRAARLGALVPGRLRSLVPVELFGRAERERDDEARRGLLQRALDEDPTFEAAARALEAVEKRLPRRDPFALGEQERAALDALERWRKKLRDEHDVSKLTAEALQRFAELQKQRRYRLLIAEASAAVALPPPPVPELSEQLPESAQYLIVAAWDELNDDDSVLREGHKFLGRFSLSNGFPIVRQLVDQAIERKNARAAGVKRAADAIARLAPSEREDRCRLARIYDEASQLRDARAAYEACLKRPGAHGDDEMKLLWVDYHLGDFQAVAQLLERLRTTSPARFMKVSRLVDELPVD